MNRLSYWINQALKARCIDDLFETLKAFGSLEWSMEERSIMSSSYTPKLLEMINENNMDEKKYTLLEDCAALCWGSGS